MTKVVSSLMALGLTVSLSANGASLFSSKGCTACHGSHGEAPALGVSKIIKDLSSEGIQTALNGYKNGTYGGAMKSVMSAYASPLSSDEVKTLADWISAQ